MNEEPEVTKLLKQRREMLERANPLTWWHVVEVAFGAALLVFMLFILCHEWLGIGR